MRTFPTLVDYMTPTVHSVNAEQMLAEAAQLMEKEGVEELAVVDNGRLVGLLTARDVKLAKDVGGVDPGTTPVAAIALGDFHLVRPEARLDQVVHTMIREKIEHTLVVSDHRVVGLFTATDALKVLEVLLNQQD